MSNFVVSARKYRPNRFEDVVGQSHVTNTLKNALKNDHLAHAFLFCGPRGVGKTTCARILAKVLNCRNAQETFEPCNQCDSCLSFNENASFNITELDAASNNSVEHIRALIEQVRFQPQQGDYKVFIIDEVHMLSQQAFNAFLKTLEEPPSYAIFILATTEKHKIIPTILSRCQIFDFKRIQVESMVEHLRSICQEEGITIDEEALHVVALKADGALRDALSIFDRIVAFSGKEIKYQDVIENLNVLDYDYYFKLVDNLLVEDISSVMLLFDEILKKGFDPDIFLSGLSEHLRNILVAKDEATLGLLTLSQGLKQRYLQQAQKASSTFILTALNLANDCDIHYKTARNKRLHVEMALIKMNYIYRAVAINDGQVAALPEKKTPDLSLAAVSETKPQENLLQESEEETVVGQDITEEADTTTTDIPVETEAPKPEEPVLLTTPKIGSMEAMLQQLKAEEAQEVVVEAKYELTLENIKKVWLEFAETIESDSVRNMLKNVDLEFNAQEVKAVVSSKLVENAVRQEVDLITKLREDFALDNLSLAIEIDKSKIDQGPKIQKPLTSKEKLRQMYEQNPEVKTLANRFGLRFDD